MSIPLYLIEMYIKIIIPIWLYYSCCSAMIGTNWENHLLCKENPQEVNVVIQCTNMKKGIALTVIWNKYKNRKFTCVHCVIYEVTLWAENVNIEIHHEYINEGLLPGYAPMASTIKVLILCLMKWRSTCLLSIPHNVSRIDMT